MDSKDTDTVIDALKVLAREHGLVIDVRRIEAEPLQATFERYLSDHEHLPSFKDMRSQCYRFLHFFGPDRTAIRQNLFDSYVESRLEKVKPASVNRELTTLKAALRNSPAPALDPDLVPMVPDESNPRVVLLDEKDIRKLLDCEERLRTWIILAIITGAKKNEIARATEESGRIILPSSKWGSPRTFLLPDFLVGKVHKLGKFPTAAWREHRILRGFEWLTWHDLRHAYDNSMKSEKALEMLEVLTDTLLRVLKESPPPQVPGSDGHPGVTTKNSGGSDYGKGKV